jgi:hypothetical protein
MSKAKIVNDDDNVIATVQAHTEPAEGNALLVQVSGLGIKVDGSVDVTVVNEPSVNLQDGSGTAITSTGGSLDSNITNEPSVKLQDGSGADILLENGRIPTANFVVDPKDPTRHQEFDNLFAIPYGMDVVHHEIHEGDTYDVFINKLGTSAIIAFKTGNVAPKRQHFEVKWRSEETATMSFWENPTWTNGSGSILTPKNLRRDSIKTSTATGNASGAFVVGQMVQDPTGFSSVGATLLFQESTWATNQAPAAQSEGKRYEHVLAPNTNYALQVTSGNGGIWLYGLWYEHSDE